MIDELLQNAVEYPRVVGAILAVVGLALILFSDWNKHDDENDNWGGFV